MRRRVLSYLVLGGAGIYLALNVRTLVREMILLPAAYAAYFIGRVLASLHQPTVWAVFLAVAGFGALASLVRFQRRRVQQEREKESYPGRIETFAHWLEMKSNSPYFNLRLARHLSELALDVLAHTEGVTREDAVRSLVAPDSDVPPAIAQYIRAAYFSGVRRRRGLSRALMRQDPAPDALDLPPAQLLEFLERRIAR